MIAKYRKAEFPHEWWLTDFTMEQVESNIYNLQQSISELEAELAQCREQLRQFQTAPRSDERAAPRREKEE